MGELAAWRKGEQTCTRLNVQFTRLPPFRFLTLDPGNQVESFPHAALADTLCKKVTSESWSGGSCFSSTATLSALSMFRQLNRREAGGSGQRKPAGALLAQSTLSPTSASTAANNARLRDQSCWSSTWRHGCHCGWTGAGRPRSSSPTRTMREILCQDPHSKRLTMFARRTRALLAAAPLGTAHEVHRFAHGLRGQVGQTPVLGTHDGISGGHRTIGLTVSPLRVLSRLRRPLAQEWGCRGKACDRNGGGSKRAPAGGGFVVVGPGQVLRTREGDKTRIPKRLLACWCASYEGWRFFEADTCATFPFWVFRDYSPKLQWRHHGSQIDVGHSSGNCAISSPNIQALECCRRHFGARCRVSQDPVHPKTHK